MLRWLFHRSIFISNRMLRFLVIQTAFIGDVILATAVLEKLHQFHPDSEIDILLRKGNERLLEGHPFLNEVIIWDKTRHKYRNLVSLIPRLRKRKYDLVINLHRFVTSGIFTVFSNGKKTVGFDKNPLSFLFTKCFPHRFGDVENPIHEVERYISLIAKETDSRLVKHRLWPTPNDFSKVKTDVKYVTISPGTVWFTKRLPAEKWVKFMDRVGEDMKIFLLGGKGEVELCNWMKNKSIHANVEVLAGSLSLLQSSALMKGAIMNFTNDSAPLHLASAVNAPVTGVFCSTVKEFGFIPLSDNAEIVETEEKLTCRPCGLHGKKKCPKGHFKCSNISVEKLLQRIGG